MPISGTAQLELLHHVMDKKRSGDKDSESSSRKRVKHKHSSKKRSPKKDGRAKIVDDDPNDEDMWVEKNVDMDGEKVRPTCLFWLENHSKSIGPGS